MIQLHTLGAVNLRRDAIEVRSVLSQPRRLALLVYLATARPRGFHSRDRLLGLFWPESDEARARNSLRQAVHGLRKSLGENVLAGRGDREIGIDRSKVWCDAAALDEAIEAGDHETAVNLYRGDFMPGFFVEATPEIERFIEDERTRLRRAVIGAAWALAAAAESRGESATAVTRGRQALAIDPVDEASVRRLIELLERTGERAAAVQVFVDFVRRLDTEYGLTPSPETIRLVERVRSGDGAASEPVAARAPAAPPAAQPVEVPGHPVGSVPVAGEVLRERTEGPTPIAPVLPPGRSRLRPAAVAAFAVVVAVLAVLGSLRSGRSRAGGPVPGPAEATVAVLPFLNMSGEPGNEVFADGVAEELTYALSRVPGIRVAGRTSAFSFKGKDVGVDSIGRALHVDYVLEGSVRTTGTRVRIVAQLIDAASGYHVWSDTWDGDLGDVLTVQSNIAAAVVSELRPRLAADTGPSPIVPPETLDPEAHADVLRGFQALYSGEIADYARADTFFRRALDRDPGYARAHAGLAVVTMVHASLGLRPRDAGYGQARAQAERALELDPALDVAHAMIARIHEEYDWDFESADRSYRRAIELNPGSETWYRQRALLLSMLGRADEAIPLARLAVEIDPLAIGAHRHLGVVLFRSRRFEEAAAAYHAALALAPDHDLSLLGLSWSLSMLGQHNAAVAAVDRVLEKEPDQAMVLAASGWVRARAGDEPGARAALDRLSALPSSAYHQATVFAWLGEYDRAFELLEIALRDREPGMIGLAVFPGFDPMRDDPRMDRLLEAVGLPD